MNFINLTPHELNIKTEDGNMLTIPASGNVARLTTETVEVGEVGGVTVRRTVFGDIEGLPKPAPNTIYIVSALVMNQAQRADVLAPGTLLRDDSGRVIGCDGLSTVSDTIPEDNSYKRVRDERKKRHAENMEKLAEIVNPNPANASNNWGMGMNTGNYEPIDLFEYLSQEVCPKPTQPEPVRGIISPIPVIEGTVIKATCIKPEQFPSPEWRALIRLDSGELVVGDTSAKVVNEGERVYYAGHSFRPNRWGKDLVVSCLKEAHEVAEEVEQNESSWEQACRRWSDAFAMERATRWNKSAGGSDDAHWGAHSND